jgi:hypothetical protein
MNTSLGYSAMEGRGCDIFHVSASECSDKDWRNIIPFKTHLNIESKIMKFISDIPEAVTHCALLFNPFESVSTL